MAKATKLLRGGNADSRLIPATLLDRVTPQLRIPDAKTFGPVNCLVRVKNTEEAVACANVNEYGLPAAVFGRDIASAFTVARKIDLGICHATGPTMHAEAQMSFGGVKGSGVSRFVGKGGWRNSPSFDGSRSGPSRGATRVECQACLAHLRHAGRPHHP